MSYNIFGSTAPAMPRPAKGTEIVKLLLSQASRDMSEPLVPMAIPALASHLTDVELMYSDNQYYELCGQMGHLVGPSGIGKAQLTRLIEAIMRPFRDHDEVEMAEKMCGGHKQMSQTIRNIYDCQRAGALRATADGVTGNPLLRVNITFSSTPEAAHLFYKRLYHVLEPDGTVHQDGRISQDV